LCFTLQQAQGINAELGLGATIDIAIESLAERAEKEIVCCSSEKNLIGHCGPFLSKFCSNLTLLQKVSLLGFLYFLSSVSINIRTYYFFSFWM